MMRVAPAVCLIALSALASDHRGISLDDAGKAQFIALGTIVRLEHRDGRPFATMEVHYVGRGKIGSTIEFYADPQADCCQPSASLGAQELVFLEPSKPDAARFQLVGHGAGAIWVHGRDRGVMTHGSQYGGVHFPQSLCDPAYGNDQECIQPLRATLAYLKLPPMPAEPRAAMFRVGSRTCPPCELSDWVEKLKPSRQLDCSIKATHAEQFDCVRRAMASHQPLNWSTNRKASIP